MLFNIQTKKWDNELCKLLSVPISILPAVKKSADDYGKVESIPELKGVPITGVVGDQQASLFGQNCVNPGQIKNTYGTGCFVMLNTGKKRIHSKHLLTTLAIDSNGAPCYALEGSVFIAGAVIQWLRDEMKLFENSADCENAALQISDTAGVYIVPAFVGLGAPYWDMEARGTIVGLTRGSSKNHIIRAALDSIAYQTYDIIQCIEHETKLTIDSLFVDGGATKNNYLMQFQADILHKRVIKTATESTAFGAALLSGLHSNFFSNKEQQNHTIFVPSMEEYERKQLLLGWKKAIRQTQAK